MARNSGGTYSLPASGNPVTSGSTISSTWANNTLGDIATELTDSLDRSGKGGMLAPLRNVDGTVASPSISFTAETGSGWFRESAGVVKGVILGTYRLLMNAVGISVNGTLGVSGVTTLSSALNFNGGNLVSTTAANTSQTVAGNRTGADSGSDVVLNSIATRTAGAIVEVQNNTVPVYKVDYNGIPSMINGLACGIAVKSDADQTESAGVATTITNMTFPVVANGVYVWEAWGPGYIFGGTTLNITHTGPAAPTNVVWGAYVNGPGISGAGANSYAGFAALAPSVSPGSLINVQGTLVNGANSGNVAIQFYWGGGGTSVTIRKGWFLRWRRIA